MGSSSTIQENCRGDAWWSAGSTRTRWPLPARQCADVASACRIQSASTSWLGDQKSLRLVVGTRMSSCWSHCPVTVSSTCTSPPADPQPADGTTESTVNATIDPVWDQATSCTSQLKGTQGLREELRMAGLNCPLADLTSVVCAHHNRCLVVQHPEHPR